MNDDDDLVDRLRRTFEHVAETSPVPPAPELPAAAPTPLRRRPPALAPFVLVAAAALVIAAVAALVVRDPDDDVFTNRPPGVDEEPAPGTPATADADGTAEARGTDGALDVTAVVAPGPAPGLVVVQVEAIDGAGRAVAVDAAGATLPGAAAVIPGCDGTDGRRGEVGFTMGTTTDATVDVVVTAVAEPCDDDGDRSEVQLHLQLASLGVHDGDDGPRSPVAAVAVAQDGGAVALDVVADAGDGCLVEVLVDWGDRSTPSRPVAACDPGAPTSHVAAVDHDYGPGTYTLRVTVSSGGADGTFQVGFVEREIVVDG